MTTRVYLIRHGATVLTAEDRFAGILGTRIHALIGSETSFPVGKDGGAGGAHWPSSQSAASAKLVPR